MSKYKFDVSLVTSGLSEGVFELQPSDYLYCEDELFDEVNVTPGYTLTVDLPRQRVVTPQGREIPFDVQPFRKECLLNGWDDIGLTLRHKDKIAAFEAHRLATKPWLAKTA